MRPRERQESGEQDLFCARLDQIIDMDHALVKLACRIDWRFLEERFGEVYQDGAGRLQLPSPRQVVESFIVSGLGRPLRAAKTPARLKQRNFTDDGL